MTAPTLPVVVRATSHRRSLLLDTLYLLAVISAVMLGGPAQLVLAVPVAAVVAVRAVHRRRHVVLAH